MTASSLFDTFVREKPTPDWSDAELASRRAALVDQLIASALADCDRISDYERLVAKPGGVGPALTRTLEESVRQLYAEWAGEADQVVARARSLKAHAFNSTALSRLEDAIGGIRARLSVAPADTARAIEQAVSGQFLPAKEFRNELHPRLRT